MLVVLQVCCRTYSDSKSKMKSRRQGRGDVGVLHKYVEETDDEANEDSALI